MAGQIFLSMRTRTEFGCVQDPFVVENDTRAEGDPNAGCKSAKNARLLCFDARGSNLRNVDGRVKALSLLLWLVQRRVDHWQDWGRRLGPLNLTG